MKAVLLYQYGGAEHLHYEDVAEPIPSPGEVLIRVFGTSVNPIDYKLRSGAMKNYMPLNLPIILGRDVAGEVVGLGEGVSTFKPGDRVMGLVNHSYAGLLTAKAADLALIPEGLDYLGAGVIPLITQTGAQLMEIGVKPQKGEIILVTGALGAVGRTAVYVAKEHGATVIAGVKGNQMKDAPSLGADRVVALDDDAEVRDLPALDAIADTVNGPTIAKLLPRLKKTGRLASVVGKPAAAGDIDVREVYARPDPPRLRQLAEDVRDGKLRIPVAQVLPLKEIRRAHELAEKGAQGKIALVP